MNRIQAGLCTLVLILLHPALSRAYLVGPAASIDQMTASADLVVKATVLSNDLVEDTAIRPLPGYDCFQTKLQIISTLKGSAPAATINLRHYATSPKPFNIQVYSPTFYDVTVGRSYIVFAKKTSVDGTYTQLTQDPAMDPHQGVLLCADDSPRREKSVKSVCWTELTALLKHSDAADVHYGIRHLQNNLLPPDRMEPANFSREDVVEAIRPLLASTDEGVLDSATAAAACRNPFASSETSIYWLATVGHGHLPPYGGGNPDIDNKPARMLWHELATIADGPAAPRVRAAAVRALGRSHVPEISVFLKRWSSDHDELVRAAAIVLLSDEKDDYAHARIEAAGADASPTVRVAAAQAIGFSQSTDLIPLLGRLLADSDKNVHIAAAESILSFSYSDTRDLLRVHIDDPLCGPYFVNALATIDPPSYLDDLRKILIADSRHDQTIAQLGNVPAYESFDILMKYIRQFSSDDLKSARMAALLDAMEDDSGRFSSTPMRDLYGIEIDKGLAARAKNFRAKAAKLFPGMDSDNYFNQMDDFYKAKN